MRTTFTMVMALAAATLAGCVEVPPDGLDLDPAARLADTAPEPGEAVTWPGLDDPAPVPLGDDDTAAIESVGVYGVVVRQLADGTLLPAANFKVKLCSNSNGTGTCASTTTDATGSYSFNPSIPPGDYWGFAWRDAIYWGSDHQSVFTVPRPIGPLVSTFDMLSRPRPLPPQAINPIDGETKVPFNSLALQWTSGLDPERSTPSWPVVYDVYLGKAGSSMNLIASNISPTSLTVSNLSAGTSYQWRVEAKMDTRVGAPGSPYYVTSSPTFTFKTRYPLLRHIQQ